MALRTLDTRQQRTETAIIRQLRIQQRQQELAPLKAELKRRGIAPFRIARYVGLVDNPNRIYDIFSGRLPAPPDFIDNICTWTGIPLSDVLPPHIYQARSSALRDDMYLEDAERMGY